MNGRKGSTLGSDDQIRTDRRAVRIFAGEPVRRAIEDLVALYRDSPAAARPNALDTLREAAEATAFAAVCGVINKDVDRPQAYWSVTTQHRWDEVEVPLSGAMIDNPDNIYRTIPIDGRAAYEIRGRVVGSGPTQETFVLHAESSGAKKDEKIRTNEAEAGSVSLHEIEVAPDGRFVITLDATDAGGRTNHLQVDPEVHAGYVLVRSTLADWSANDASELRVHRLSGPPVRPEPDDAALAELAAERTRTTGRYWLAWCQKFFFDRPGNAVTHAFARVSGWGQVSCGHYELGPDQALLVRLDRRDAAYLGFQLSDNWGQGQALRYIERLGSLNGSQALPDPDGGYTFVIAARDPGVHNWLDTVGSAAGTFGIRWQKLPGGGGAADAIRRMEVVDLAGLDRALPDGTPRCTPAQRRAQLEARVESYRRRLVV